MEADNTSEERSLIAEGLSKTYKRRRVVNDVHVRVRQGEVVGLLGPNGAGKTTTFYMIVGIIRPDNGRILIDRAEITRWPMYRRARAGIGYLAQEPSIFRRMTVEQNLMAILETLPLSRAERRTRMERLLDDFGIGHLAKQKAYTLSGGERRRTEISRVLTTEPQFILLDEPFAGIDPIAVEDIQRIIRQLKERNIGVLITDHNVRETLQITDRAYIMAEGQIVLSGTSEQLANDPEARRIYLGERFRLD
ncbi:MAG: LPS export ABC transporter ATP-binding protein [candidate division Zixibacteria bacterium]|nr:LPS export ABC transporter ATP-binding protein [candidate division Zixibacteria bacterium]